MEVNKKLIIPAVLVFIHTLLWAGNTAVFVDLGFSADGKTYMFGQYGIHPKTLRPWADLFIVDVISNRYIPEGRINYQHNSPVQAGHDGSGALYLAIARNAALADRYRINYLLQGHLLYISMENGIISGNETIEFRDFERSDSFRAALVSSGYGSREGLSFYINLEKRSSTGSSRIYTVGNPGIKRPGISSYRIRRVMAAPNTNALVFVIETRKPNTDGSTDIRYMVETIRL
jgi:predicted secreted protein